METTLWIAAGIILGWLSYSFLRFNAERGMVASMMIGAVGALVGAKAVAPVFVSAASAGRGSACHSPSSPPAPRSGFSRSATWCRNRFGV